MLSDTRRIANARPTARESLRAATHDVHMRLHRHPSFERMADGTIAAEAYKHLLARLYGFHAPLETVLFEAASDLAIDVDINRRRRVHRLRDDLLALQLTEAQINALPSVVALPTLTTRGSLMGALYVREGSMLGGRVLARGLDGLLGSASLRGRQYLTGNPDEHGLWQSCCLLIEEVAVDGHLDDMIASAIGTFVALEAWLEDDQY